MNTIHILFGLLLLMAVALIAICMTEEVSFGRGYDHPDFPSATIKQAPDGYRRHQGVVLAAGCFAALTTLFTVAICTLGLNARHRQGLG